jgi:hypothetical protein
MNTGSTMRIKPFEEHKDQLFTDYALQLFNAHCSDDSQELIKYLINSLEEEATNNNAFMPGLIFGCMVHMLMMSQALALEKGLSLDESVSSYIKMYQKNRSNLAKMLGNRPDYARDLVKEELDEEF